MDSTPTPINLEVTFQAWTGIDVSKETLDVCFLPETGKVMSGKFGNNKSGHVQLLKWVKRHTNGSVVHFCMEATGSHSNAVALFLTESDQMVSVVNPTSIHYWTKSRGVGNKTDKADAKTIAEYARTQKPEIRPIPTPEVRELTALTRHLDNLQSSATQDKNRLKEPGLSCDVKKSINKMLKQVEAEITYFQKLIKKHLDDHPTLKRDRNLLMTIPGIAGTTAAKVLAELPDVTQFQTASAAAKYAGLAPSQHESGTSIRKRTQVYKPGNRRLKTALHMPALSAIQWNEPVKQIYQRLVAKGHKGASALAAAKRKLLMIAVGVLRTQQPFRADFATANA